MEKKKNWKSNENTEVYNWQWPHTLMFFLKVGTSEIDNEYANNADELFSRIFREMKA